MFIFGLPEGNLTNLYKYIIILVSEQIYTRLHKMIKSTCDVMKKSIMLSAFFLTIGALLEIAAQFLTLESMLPVYFAYAGVFAIFLGIVGILATLIAVMIPKVNHNLRACQH